MAPRHNHSDDNRARWRALTWADVGAWAGLRSVERGRLYCRGGRVSGLALTRRGELLAWVRGGDRYATRVWLSGQDESPLCGRCTCPVDASACKHAVAAVLAYLDALRHGRAVPPAEPADPRPYLLDGEPAATRTRCDDQVEQARRQGQSEEAALRQAVADALAHPVPSACEDVMPHLRRLCGLLRGAGRAAEWDDYEADLRRTFARRPRLLEVLDRLRPRPIIA